MESNIEEKVRKELREFVGYSASTSPDVLKDEIDTERIIKLDANENPYGCSPKVYKALAEFRSYNIYPDAGQTELRSLLAKYTGVDAERIVISNGSDQMIEMIVRLFIDKGDEVVNLIPTFLMYDFYARLRGGKIVSIPRDDNFNVDIKRTMAAIGPKTKLLFLANPNAPTGNITQRDEIITLLESGLPLVVDEAYYEFCQQTVIDLIDKYPNLMVIRTFSKWAGLAGLRVGYGVFPLKLASYLMVAKPPYNVNTAAQVAVRESFKDVVNLKKNIYKIIRERDRLFRKLNQIKWLKPYPSKTNFILCSVLNGRAKEISEELKKRGVLIRYFDKKGFRDYLRISVGKPKETDILIKTLLETGG